MSFISECPLSEVLYIYTHIIVTVCVSMYKLVISLYSIYSSIAM